MTYNVFGGTLNLTQLSTAKSCSVGYICTNECTQLTYLVCLYLFAVMTKPESCYCICI